MLSSLRGQAAGGKCAPVRDGMLCTGDQLALSLACSQRPRWDWETNPSAIPLGC